MSEWLGPLWDRWLRRQGDEKEGDRTTKEKMNRDMPYHMRATSAACPFSDALFEFSKLCGEALSLLGREWHVALLAACTECRVNSNIYAMHNARIYRVCYQ